MANEILDQDLKLVNFEFAEWHKDRLDWKIEKFTLGDFKVVLGDNAHGKTRLFNVLSFLRSIHTGERKFNNPDYKGKYTLWFETTQDKIFYSAEISGISPGPGLLFKEVIKRNEEVLFDRAKNVLIDEGNKQSIEKFLLPPNLPVTASVQESSYITFKSIQSFLERMLFLAANRHEGPDVSIDLEAMVMNNKGSNVGSVMANWKEKLPLVYKEVLDAFKDIFPFIKDVYIKEQSFKNVIKAPLLFMKEKDVEADIQQTGWSDGLLRTLSHIVLPCTQFLNSKDKAARPSFIGIDEVENGLDYNTLTKIINHYESYSNLVQTLISTHSPLVCNIVHPKDWLIIKRIGNSVKLFPPDATEDLNKALSKLKDDNWNFYRRHIATSKLYRA